MRERPLEQRPVQCPEQPHHRVCRLVVERALEKERAEHRHEGQRDDRRGQHGERLGERQRVEEFPFLAGQREDRDEGEQDDRHREEDRSSDQPRRFEDRVPHGLPIAWIDTTTLDIPERVLHDDDARVDQHADGDRDARQAHDVRGDAGVIHAEEGDEHGQRQRQRHDEDRAEVHQEDDLRKRDERDFLDERRTQRVHRLRDQRGAVVERNNAHAGRQARADLRDAGLHAVDHLLRVGAAAGDDDAAHDFVPPFHQRCDPERVADVHLRHLAHVDRHASRRADDDLLDVVDRFNQPDAADDRPRAVCLEHVAADILIAVADRFDDGAERQVVRTKPGWVDVDLVLLDLPADRRHFSNARDGVELVLDEPVLDATQVAQRVAVALDGVPEDVAHSRRVGSQRRRGALGHLGRDQAEALEDARAREVLVHVVLEHHVDHREAERGLRPDDAHTRQALEVDRERVADLILHLLRAVTGPAGEHDHLVVREIGNRIDRRGGGGPPSPRAEHHGEADDDDAVLQR